MSGLQQTTVDTNSSTTIWVSNSLHNDCYTVAVSDISLLYEQIPVTCQTVQLHMSNISLGFFRRKLHLHIIFLWQYLSLLFFHHYSHITMFFKLFSYHSLASNINTNNIFVKFLAAYFVGRGYSICFYEECALFNTMHYNLSVSPFQGTENKYVISCVCGCRTMWSIYVCAKL